MGVVKRGTCARCKQSGHDLLDDYCRDCLHKSRMSLDPLSLRGLKPEFATGIFLLHSLRLAVIVALLGLMANVFKGWPQYALQATMVAVVVRQMYLHWRYERRWVQLAHDSSAEAKVKAVIKRHMKGDEPPEKLAGDILAALKEK